MSNIRFCDACGSPQAASFIGGACLCRKCEPEIMDILRKKHEAGESRVSAIAEARKIFREQYSAKAIILKDFPAELKRRAQDKAAQQGLSLRDFILEAIHKNL